MPKEADAKDFIRALVTATGKIEAKYFDVPVSHPGRRHNTIYSERVYCYELYHQVRNLWESGRYTLNGELSKVNHPNFQLERLRKIPDFVAHMPGGQGFGEKGNLVIVEAKSAAGVNGAAIRKDLETLAEFVRSCKYHSGVYLVFGDKDPIKKVQRAQLKLCQAGHSFEKVTLFWHMKAGEVAKKCPWTSAQ